MFKQLKQLFCRDDVLTTYDRPVILYSRRAHEKVRYLVDSFPVELGWVELTEKVSDFLYIIHDIRAFKQVGMPATFTHHEDDRFAVMAEMLEMGVIQPGMVDAGLGHSHVYGGVVSSPTDEAMMGSLRELGGDYSIQTVHNKKGDVFASVWDWANKRYHVADVEIDGILSDAEYTDLDMQMDRITIDYGHKTKKKKAALPLQGKSEVVTLASAPTNPDIDPEAWGVSKKEYASWTGEQKSAFEMGIPIEDIRNLYEGYASSKGVVA